MFGAELGELHVNVSVVDVEDDTEKYDGGAIVVSYHTFGYKVVDFGMDYRRTVYSEGNGLITSTGRLEGFESRKLSYQISVSYSDWADTDDPSVLRDFTIEGSLSLDSMTTTRSQSLLHGTIGVYDLQIADDYGWDYLNTPLFSGRLYLNIYDEEWFSNDYMALSVLTNGDDNIMESLFYVIDGNTGSRNWNSLIAITYHGYGEDDDFWPSQYDYNFDIGGEMSWVLEDSASPYGFDWDVGLLGYIKINGNDGPTSQNLAAFGSMENKGKVVGRVEFDAGAYANTTVDTDDAFEINLGGNIHFAADIDGWFDSEMDMTGVVGVADSDESLSVLVDGRVSTSDANQLMAMRMELETDVTHKPVFEGEAKTRMFMAMDVADVNFMTVEMALTSDGPVRGTDDWATTPMSCIKMDMVMDDPMLMPINMNMSMVLWLLDPADDSINEPYRGFSVAEHTLGVSLDQKPSDGRAACDTTMILSMSVSGDIDNGALPAPTPAPTTEDLSVVDVSLRISTNVKASWEHEIKLKKILAKQLGIAASHIKDFEVTSLSQTTRNLHFDWKIFFAMHVPLSYVGYENGAKWAAKASSKLRDSDFWRTLGAEIGVDVFAWSVESVDVYRGGGYSCSLDKGVFDWFVAYCDRPDSYCPKPCDSGDYNDDYYDKGGASRRLLSDMQPQSSESSFFDALRDQKARTKQL